MPCRTVRGRRIRCSDSGRRTRGRCEAGPHPLCSEPPQGRGLAGEYGHPASALQHRGGGRRTACRPVSRHRCAHSDVAAVRPLIITVTELRPTDVRLGNGHTSYHSGRRCLNPSNTAHRAAALGPSARGCAAYGGGSGSDCGDGGEGGGEPAGGPDPVSAGVVRYHGRRSGLRFVSSVSSVPSVPCGRCHPRSWARRRSDWPGLFQTIG